MRKLKTRDAIDLWMYSSRFKQPPALTLYSDAGIIFGLADRLEEFEERPNKTSKHTVHATFSGVIGSTSPWDLPLASSLQRRRAARLHFGRTFFS